MPNAKVRCRQCHNYFPRERAVYEYCGNACRTVALGRPAQAPPKASAAKRRRIPAKIQAIVRERDFHRCRWCGNHRGCQSHHIAYRSECGADAPWNLVTLCAACHALAHTNKRLYKPLLQTTMWLEYFHDTHLTIPQCEKWLNSMETPT